MPSSRASSPPRDRTQVSCIAGGFSTAEPSGKPLPESSSGGKNLFCFLVLFFFLKKKRYFLIPEGVTEEKDNTFISSPTPRKWGLNRNPYPVGVSQPPFANPDDPHCNEVE